MARNRNNFGIDGSGGTDCVAGAHESALALPVVQRCDVACARQRPTTKAVGGTDIPRDRKRHLQKPPGRRGFDLKLRRGRSCSASRELRGASPPSISVGQATTTPASTDAFPNERGGGFGIPVNGFHPRLSAPRDPRGMMLLLPVLGSGPDAVLSLPDPSSVTRKRTQDKIDELIRRLRSDEEERRAKRRKLLSRQSSGKANNDAKETSGGDAARNNPMHCRCSGDEPKLTQQDKKRRRAAAWEAPNEEPTFAELYNDVFLMSPIPQIIATPGGRVIAWNKDFLSTTGYAPADVTNLSMTVFNLIQPAVLPKLFELFSLALRGGTAGGVSEKSEAVGDSTTTNTEKDRREPEEDEEEANETFASMTLPCVSFPTLSSESNETPGGRPRGLSSKATATGPFHITLTLMNDANPSKRCFHCILSKREVFPCNSNKGKHGNKAPSRLTRSPAETKNGNCGEMGEIRSIDSENLMRLLGLV